jgi:lysophospholipid acyltransferase
MNSTLIYRLLYVHFACVIARTKYYVAWKLSEGACNFCGIGYNGRDEETGKEMWNRVQNVKIRGFELPANPKQITESWNIKTSRWLKYYVYFRITDPRGGGNTALATVLTNMTSAVWHGIPTST